MVINHLLAGMILQVITWYLNYRIGWVMREAHMTCSTG